MACIKINHEVDSSFRLLSKVHRHLSQRPSPFWSRYRLQFDWISTSVSKRGGGNTKRHPKYFSPGVVPRKDHDPLRFLWCEVGLLENILQFCRMCVYLFGIVFSPSSINFANKQIAMDYEKEYSLTTVNSL